MIRCCRVMLVVLGLVGLVVGLVASTVLASVAPAVRATPAIAAEPVQHVIIVGIPGLKWEHVTKKDTPTLWRLADQGSIGALSVRAATALTCPADGWITLGAGNRARGPGHPSRICPPVFPISEPLPQSDGSARLLEQPYIADENARLRYGAKPGMLASSVRCVNAVGAQASVAAARPNGRVDHYDSELPRDPMELFGQCPLSIVSLPEVGTENRTAELLRIDADLAAVERSRPEGSLLMVMGVADLIAPPALHVAIVDGSGFDQRWLVSPSTRREPYVQLIDIAPTVFDALDVGTPRAVVGQPIMAGDSRGASIARSIAELTDANRAAKAQRPLVQPSFTLLVGINLALMVVAAVFFRRRQLTVEETLPDPAAGHTGHPHLFSNLAEARFAKVIEVAALCVATLPIASFLANAVPWWRLGSGGAPAVLTHTLTLVAVIAVIAVLALRGPWARHPLGPPTFVAAITGGVLALDVITGSRLQLDALAGYSPLVAGRFIGFGNLAFAVFAAGALIGTAYIAQAFQGWWRIAFMGGVGLVAVVVVGAPSWGSDVGGIVALTPAFVAATMRAAGIWLSPLRILASLATGLVAVVIFAWVDYARPAEDRTHLGRFVAQLLDGTAGTVVQRKAEANFSLLMNSQLTVLVIVVALFVPLVLMRRSAGLRRVFGLYPCARAGALGVLVAGVIGFAVNDSGVAVPAFMAAVAVPLILVTILRVLADATDGSSS